jgi:hypothetical protein
VAAIVGETADSWTYATATVRAANNSTGMRVSFVVGGNVEPVRASYGGGLGTGTAYSSLGVGLDSTSVFAGLPGTLTGSGTVGSAFGLYDALVGEAAGARAQRRRNGDLLWRQRRAVELPERTRVPRQILTSAQSFQPEWIAAMPPVRLR